MKKKHKSTDWHGGKRPGAGRPKTKEDTVVMRVPKSLALKVKSMIEKHRRG